MSTTLTETITVIYKITLDKPYVNRADGIISKITFGSMEHERKTYYQPGEKDIFRAAGIDVKEIILPRISEGRTVIINEVSLSKKSDTQFEFSISSDVTFIDDIDYKIEKEKVIDEAELKFILVRKGLDVCPEGYVIKSFKRIVCESGTEQCDDSSTRQTRFGEKQRG